MTGDEITIDNVSEVEFLDLHRWAFGLVNVHVDYLSMNRDKFAFLLGYYPAVYATVAELFTFMINKVRVAMELGDKMQLDRFRDKRDLLEQVLKTLKLQYEGLSRKITLLAEGPV